MRSSTILRSVRETAGLSQRALSRVSRSTQPALSRIEAGAADATVGRLDGILAGLGSQVAVLPTIAPTIAAWADYLAECIAQDDWPSVRVGFIRIADSLGDLAPDVRVAACVQRPPTTGHDGVDAALAATVDHLLHAQQLPVPAWTEAIAPAREPFFLVPNSAVREIVEAETPPAFRRRNVFVPSDFFASV